MIIEINKDIDRYKETLIMGLTTKQLIFSIASIVIGGGIVLFLYPYIGLTISVYIAIPVVAPIALGGFYEFNGMGFYEVIHHKLIMIFINHPLTYSSTENEDLIKLYNMKKNEKVFHIKKNKQNKNFSKLTAKHK